MNKPVVFRRSARIDVEAAADWYAAHAGQRIAMRFARALSQTVQGINQRPTLGSLRYEALAAAPGLRSRVVKGFPYAVLYVVGPNRIEIWRVLHGARDIPSVLRGSGGPESTP